MEERACLAEKFSTTMEGLVPADRGAAIVRIRPNPSLAGAAFRIVLMIAGAIHQLISSLDVFLGAFVLHAGRVHAGANY